MPYDVSSVSGTHLPNDVCQSYSLRLLVPSPSFNKQNVSRTMRFLKKDLVFLLCVSVNVCVCKTYTCNAP